MSKPTAREVERVLGAELLEQLRHYMQTSTEALERLAGQAINNTLMVWSGIMPTEGRLSWDFQVPIGAVTVVNLGTAVNLITVASAGPAEIVPTGLGTYPIAGGTSATVPIAGRQVTVYGTAGDRLGVQIYTAPVRPVTR